MGCALVLCVCAGGAGGKGTWGGMMEVYDEDGHTHDNRDPNYDSEEEVVRVQEGGGVAGWRQAVSGLAVW